MSDNIRNLQHGSADTLGQKAADAVFPEAGNGKPHHLAAAADGCSTGCRAGQAENDAKSSRTDRQCQYHTHDDGNDDSHDQRLLNGAPVNDITKLCHDGRNRRPYNDTCSTAGDDRYCRCDQKVQLRFACRQGTDGNAGKSCDKSGERITGTAVDKGTIGENGTGDNSSCIGTDHTCSGS